MSDKVGGHCDLCHADLAIGETVYVHGTPSTAESLEEAQADPSVSWFEDPHWGVCEGCHNRVLALDAGRISVERWGVIQTKRALRNQAVIAIGLPEAEEVASRNAQIEHVMQVLAAFARCHVPEWYAEENEGIDPRG